MLIGTTLTCPAYHQVGGEANLVRPLADLRVNSRIDGGVPRVLTLVHPRDIPGLTGQDTITVQQGRAGWRLSGILLES